MVTRTPVLVLFRPPPVSSSIRGRLHQRPRSPACPLPPPETAGFSSPLQFCGHESECFSLAVAVEAARCACSDSILHVSLKRSPRTPLSHFLVGFTCVIPTLLWGKAGFSWISWDSRRCDLLTFPPCSLLGPFAICCGRKLRRGQSGEQDRASQTVPLGGRAR